jgi:fatty acyl-CoA reductase
VAEDRGQQRIAERLEGRTLLITGATGFLGKAVLGACLRLAGKLGEIRLLLRARDDAAARARLEAEILPSAPVAGPAGEARAQAPVEGRLRAFSGDLRAPELGRGGDLTPFEGVDAVIHCAASVSFEEPLDQILELNALGTRALARALRRAGSQCAFVHVSTAYAAGWRTGLVLELPAGAAPAEAPLDIEAELGAARTWRAELEAGSRAPERERRLLARARRELSGAGALAVARRAEELRRHWVEQQLVERGRQRARALGFTDTYALSKAAAERLLAAEAPGPLTIVRPSVIESALRDPFPGWLEGLKVADPVILAYASGAVQRFPGERAARFDVVPVDLVANACVAAAAHPPAGPAPRTIAIAAGKRNPLTVGEMADMVTEHFRAYPLADGDGLPVEVERWRFHSSRQLLRALDASLRALDGAHALLDRAPPPGSDALELRLHRERRRLERLRRLAEIYGCYVEIDCMFDDRRALELLAALHPDDRLRFDFDTAAIDWGHYIGEVHLPALRALIRPAPKRPPKVRLSTARTQSAERPEGLAHPAAALGDGPRGLAFFDLEGVVLDASLVHFYAWLRGSAMPTVDRGLWLALLATRALRWRALDRRSRAAFNRSFYRQYRGLPAEELRALAADGLREFILPRVRHAAVRRIRAHRERGDRVVIVTGALDFLVAPLAHLADELIAARLREQHGAFTGELAEPALSADGRASLAAALAAERAVPLDCCHAYGDSISDLPLLELVGHPAAVNPDFRLEREARRRGWTVLRWEAER